MKLLLVLGNGFDINLGLPTSFRNFLEYYKTPIAEEDPLAVQQLKQYIAGDIDTWADLESQLGKTVAKYKEEAEFLTAYKHLKTELQNYLTEVDKLGMDLSSEEQETFVQDLIHFNKYLDVHQKNVWDSYPPTSTKDNLEIDVLTFNYTSSFERLGNVIKGKGVKLGKILHIHQTLIDGINMGVDSEAQINQGSCKLTYRLKAHIIKPFANVEYDDGIDVDCRKLIANADALLLFGLSLDKTDKTWWNTIARVLHGNNKKVIYVPYDTQPPTTDRHEVLERNEDLYQKTSSIFTSRTNYSVSKGQILPIRGNQMFSFHFTDEDVKANYNKVVSPLLGKRGIDCMMPYVKS